MCPSVAGECFQYLPAGKSWPQTHISRNVGGAARSLRSIFKRIHSVEANGAGAGSDQAQQAANSSGLAGAVGAEKPLDRAGVNVHIHPVEDLGFTKGLIKTSDLYWWYRSHEPHCAL